LRYCGLTTMRKFVGGAGRGGTARGTMIGSDAARIVGLPYTKLDAPCYVV